LLPESPQGFRLFYFYFPVIICQDLPSFAVYRAIIHPIKMLAGKLTPPGIEVC